MQPSDFTRDKWGRLVKAAEGYWAFVPQALPPSIFLDWKLVRLLSDADRELAQLAGVARNLPNPHLLIRPFIAREAVLSSRIEGTQASLSDLFLFEAGDVTPSRAPDVQEVANYVKALNFGLGQANKLPPSLRLIKEMHARLMEGVRGERMTPGEFRRRQNWIGPDGCQGQDATYVPPPLPEMSEALNVFERYIHAPSEFPPLTRMAMIHYQFEAIHPFLDGNGRVGRLLISLLFCHEKLLPQPLLYLSAFFERERQEYYRLLLAVSQKGEWRQWIDFFLRGVVQQSRDAVGRAGRLLDLREQLRKRLSAKRSSSLVTRLVDYLFENPAITITSAAKLLKVTSRAASLNIQKLVKARLLFESTGRERNRIFVAVPIIQAIEAQELPTDR